MKNSTLTSPPRQRTSVAIQGLDISTPDDLVKDGKCETLHNMRFNAEAWRPVHRHRGKTVTLGTGNAISGSYFTILYKHPVDNEGVYIARRTLKQANNPSKYIISRYDTSTQTSTDIATFDSQPNISHFGNVLIFNSKDKINYYIFKDEKYLLVNFPECAETKILTKDTSSPQPTWVYGDGKWTYIPDYKQTEVADFLKNYFQKTVFHLENVTQGRPVYSNEGEHWRGEILLFTTYRMADGTNISPSPIRLIKTHASAPTVPPTVTRRVGLVRNTEDVNADLMFGIQYETAGNSSASKDMYAPVSDGTLQKASFVLRVRVPEGVDSSAIESVAVWTTRINPTYAWTTKYNVIRDDIERSTNAVDYYAELDFGQPFYLLEEIKITDLEREMDPNNPIYTGYLYRDIYLTGTNLSQIINNEVYTPNNNIHDIVSNNTYDYNESCHFFAPLLRLAKPYTPIGAGQERMSVVKIPIDGHTYNTQRVDDEEVVIGSDTHPFVHLISYPDYRAKEYLMSGYDTILLSESIANNFAYYHAPHTEKEKFPIISRNNNFNTIDIPEDCIVPQPNRILVSKPNNIFSLPFNYSYKAGNSSNRILALQSAAIKIGDEQVGSLPLYVFTEEGIYALRAGESTLYSAVNPINHDRIINPSTISVNGAVAYITEKGVHILTGEGSKVISTPIHGADGIPDIDFLKSCVFLAPKQFNEIVLLDGRKGTTKTHYVYNLDYGYWSTRELDGTKINTDELVDNGAGIIYDLNDEDEDVALDCKITTRPIKLGNVDYKRLETIIPRINSGDDGFEYTLNLEGSSDGKIYNGFFDSEKGLRDSVGAKQNNPLVIRRAPFSAKYFKLQLNLIPVNEDEFATSITHIDFEWYSRFSRRMR